MKMLNKLFSKLGFVPEEENRDLLNKMLLQAEGISKLKYELQKTKAEKETWYKTNLETNTENNNLRIEIAELKNFKKTSKDLTVDALSKVQQSNKIAKELKRKNSVLLNKQAKWKGIITQLEADKHNLQVQLDNCLSNTKWKDEYDLLIKELESLGIEEPNDITELQAENQKLKKQNSLMARLQILQSNLIDTYKYGFAFSYLDSLKPRTVVELKKKDLQNGNSN